MTAIFIGCHQSMGCHQRLQLQIFTLLRQQVMPLMVRTTADHSLQPRNASPQQANNTAAPTLTYGCHPGKPQQQIVNNLLLLAALQINQVTTTGTLSQANQTNQETR